MTDLYTVLVPTRDRCDTLRSTLSSCLAEDADNLRVVVSDNCSEDATRDVVYSFGDPRLRYLRTERRLSMSGNFEFSLTAAPSGYIMHLGDDDGLIPGAIDHVGKVVRDSKALAVTSAHATYHWPSSLFQGYRNRMTLPIAKGYAMRDALRAAARVAQFRENYPVLPGTYSGFVHRSVVDLVMIGGRYYSSITPDSFSGFADAGVLDHYAYTYRPFALAGLSGRSNGASQVTNNDDREATRYSQENDLPVHPAIIYCRQSLPIVVAEAFLQARDQVPRLKSIEFDFAHLAHVALRDASPENYPVVRDTVAQIAQRNGISLKMPLEPTISQATIRTIDRNVQRVRRMREGYRKIDAGAHGVTDIAGAARLARELLGDLTA